MKKFVMMAIVATLFLVSTAVADTDLSALTEQELYDLRLQVNNEIAARCQDEPGLESSVPLNELFPDKVLAAIVRDELGLFSMSDPVSQEELDRVTTVHVLSHNDGLCSLQGIHYLRNLRELSLYWQDGLTDIPEEIGLLTRLERLSLEKCRISALPDSLCNLQALKSLNVSKTKVDQLPDDIGNLINLKTLDISETAITTLPSSIYALELDKFYRDGLELE